MTLGVPSHTERHHKVASTDSRIAGTGDLLGCMRWIGALFSKLACS